MTEKPPQNPPGNATAEEAERDDSPEQPDAGEVRDADADEVEQELFDAMKKLRRTNKKVEEYLDGLAREVEKPSAERPPEQTEESAE